MVLPGSCQVPMILPVIMVKANFCVFGIMNSIDVNCGKRMGYMVTDVSTSADCDQHL